MQMGKYAARMIADEVAGKVPSGDRRPFRYFDKGMLATIGRAKAVGLVFGFKIAGLFAWLFWAGVHIMYLIGFRNRLLVRLEWGWAYIVFQRGARLITGTTDLELRRPRTDLERESPMLESPKST
jgi:NADH dehydrogenase